MMRSDIGLKPNALRLAIVFLAACLVFAKPIATQAQALPETEPSIVLFGLSESFTKEFLDHSSVPYAECTENCSPPVREADLVVVAIESWDDYDSAFIPTVLGSVLNQIEPQGRPPITYIAARAFNGTMEGDMVIVVLSELRDGLRRKFKNQVVTRDALVCFSALVVSESYEEGVRRGGFHFLRENIIDFDAFRRC